ncbi:MAG: transaldolase family protein, partial [Holdemania filiformis]
GERVKFMGEKTYFHRVNELTPTRFWINNVTQEEAKWALAEGACGCTQNPAYVWKMMQRESELPKIQRLIMRLRDQGVARDQILIAVQRELVGRIAKLFLPLYQQSQGQWGYVSIQGDPFHEDCDSIVKTGLFNREAGENIMIKIPVTEEGLKAIGILAAQGVPINATEVMSVRQAMDVGRFIRKRQNIASGRLRSITRISRGFWTNICIQQYRKRGSPSLQMYCFRPASQPRKKPMQ